MRLVLFLLLVFCSVTLTAQNLTGIWRGTRTQSAGGCFPEYSLELQITYAGNSIMGRAYNFYDKEKFTKINFSGRYNPQTKRMVIIESAVLQYNIPSYCIPCIKTYDLFWTQNGIEEALSGEWKGHEMGNANACPPGKIYLTRQTELEIAKSISEGLARKVLAANVNGQVWDAIRPISEDATLKLLTWDDKDGKTTFWHSSAHLMAEAVESLFPGVKFWVGPALTKEGEKGFYYDMDLGGSKMSEEDLRKLEVKMNELAKANNGYIRKEIGKFAL